MNDLVKQPCFAPYLQHGFSSSVQASAGHVRSAIQRWLAYVYVCCVCVTKGDYMHHDMQGMQY